LFVKKPLQQFFLKSHFEIKKCVAYPQDEFLFIKLIKFAE
jgi:hypothetical protein